MFVRLNPNAVDPRLALCAVLAACSLMVPGPLIHAATPDPSPFFEMVKLPAGYSVAKYEVTQAQYETVTGENPSARAAPDHPVDTVSWEDAVSFCEKLTAREKAAGRLPAGYVYDLPTDAQWDEFSVGTDPRDGVLSLAGPHASTEPVGSRRPNPLGLYDVVGNVWEWCRDWYDNSIRKKDDNKDLPAALSDAEAAANGPEELYKVLRGGSWDTGPADGFTLRSRLRYAVGMANHRTGFRCVLVPALSK